MLYKAVGRSFGRKGATIRAWHSKNMTAAAVVVSCMCHQCMIVRTE